RVGLCSRHALKKGWLLFSSERKLRRRSRTFACNETLDYSAGLKFRFCTICFKTPLEETRCVGGSFKAMSEPNLAIRSSILDVVRHRYCLGFPTSITSGSMLILLVSHPPNGCTLAREFSSSATRRLFATTRDLEMRTL